MHRRRATAFKVNEALEALRERKALAEPSRGVRVHAAQTSQWKKQALDGLPAVSGAGRTRLEIVGESLKDELYRKIGRLNPLLRVELDWLKNARTSTISIL